MYIYRNRSKHECCLTLYIQNFLIEKFNSTEIYKSKAAQVETSPSKGYGICSLKIGSDGKVKEVNFYRISFSTKRIR